MEQLRARADNGDKYAASRLADLLTEQGQVEDALQVLRPHVDRSLEFTDGNEIAADTWAKLLARHGRTEQLRERPTTATGRAADRLVDLLTKEERVEDLERELAAGTSGAVAALLRVRSRAKSHGD